MTEDSIHDEDCIHKAIELADGFALMHTTVAGAIKYAYPGGSIAVLATNFPQWFLDALRCQLERQINTIHHYEVITMIETSCIRDWQYSPKYHDIASVTGYDCTMNTIKVVVDSKKLEKSK